jgi:3-oxoacyl-[acyl-carrier-protein] synthase II
MGSALGGVGMAEEQCLVFLQKGMRAIDLSLALSVYGGAANCRIGMDLGITGPSLSNANSCASGTMAIGEAVNAIRAARADVLLSGGAESPLYPLCFGAFDIIKSMSTRNDEPKKACRPFDAERDGFVMGEGSAVLVLEEMGHALRRDAPILCEVAGYACANDAYHMTAPRPDGSIAAQAMRLAMEDAGLSQEEIEYVNAHGSSTPLNDAAETIAIKSALGDRAYRIPISGTKSMHGHSLGAAGAIEACATILAISEGIIPPTANLDAPSPECDLDYVPHRFREQRVSCALSNSFGFGGINAVLALRAP